MKTLEETLRGLPTVAQDSEVAAVDARIARLRDEADLLGLDLRAARTEESDAAQAFTDSLVADDVKATNKASARIGYAALARQRVHAQLVAVASGIDRAAEQRPAVLQAAALRVFPTWSRAIEEAGKDEAEAELAAYAARGKHAALQARLGEIMATSRRVLSLVNVTFVDAYQTAECRYSGGETAAFAPAVASGMVARRFAVWAEPWRRALVETLAPPTAGTPTAAPTVTAPGA